MYCVISIRMILVNCLRHTSGKYTRPTKAYIATWKTKAYIGVRETMEEDLLCKKMRWDTVNVQCLIWGPNMVVHTFDICIVVIVWSLCWIYVDPNPIKNLTRRRGQWWVWGQLILDPRLLFSSQTEKGTNSKCFLV